MSYQYSSGSSPYDVIVLGMGAAGMTSALMCHLQGLRVLILEKADKVGGSTAISGGATWIPNHHRMAETGHTDSPEKAMTYMVTLTGTEGSTNMQKTFVKEAPDAIKFVTERGLLSFTIRTAGPDYYPNMEGANLGGRPLDPAPFDGRKLGKKGFKLLLDPLEEFMVFGKMMVTISDVNHLLNAHKSLSSFAYSMKLLLRYAMDRLQGYHRGTRLLLGNSMAAQLFHQVLKYGIEYRLNAAVKRLLHEKEGVSGVELDDGSLILANKAVILACGGFPWDLDKREKLFPKPTRPLSMQPKSNTGDGINYAMAIGGQFGSAKINPVFWAPYQFISIRVRPFVIRIWCGIELSLG